jgi:acyl carrier protein
MGRELIESELQRFISEELVTDRSTPILPDTSLIASGIIDSMGLLQIFGFIQQTYGVDLAAVGQPKDFETVRALSTAIERLR